MEIPAHVGVGPIGDQSWVEVILAALRTMQGVGGYSDDEGSARVGELLAWAHALADGASALDAVASSLSPARAEELLAEWERGARIPNDAARTIAQRQARRVSISAMRGGAAPQILEALARAGLASADLRQVTAAAIATAAAESEAVFQGGLLLADADWTPAARAAAVDVLRRLLPAWHFGAHRRAEPSRMLGLSSAFAPAWESGGVFGRSLLSDAPVLSAGIYVPASRGVSRMVSYAPLSRVDADDVNRWQEALLCTPVPSTASTALASSLAESRAVFFAVEVANGTSAEILTGIDPRQRYVRAVYQLATTDVRPGGAADDSSVGTYSELFWATRSGVASRALEAGLTFTASSTAISIANATGGTRYLVGCLIVSPKVDSGSRAQRVLTFSDGAPLSGATVAWWSAVRDGGMPRAANGADVDGWTGYPSGGWGAVHRVLVLPKTTRPASASTVYVVDTSIDWRDRICALFIAAGASADADPEFPGVEGDDDYTFIGPAAPFYTGSGNATPGTDALNPYELDLVGLRLSARASDGALIVEHPAGSADAHVMLSLLIVASDRLGVRSAAPALPTLPTPVASDPIEPVQLNWPQDGGVYSQVRQGDEGGPIVAMPLGPVIRGSTRTPVSWTTRRRRGIVGDLAPVETRQPVAGRLRKYFAAQITNGSVVVLDDGHDWRDRIAHVSLAHDTGDIRPGGAQEANINTTSGTVQWGRYLGSGGDAYLVQIVNPLPNSLRLRASSSTGALELANNTGSTRYVVGMIEAGPHLGPRSP